MLTELLVKQTVYIVTGYTDMRRGIDGLCRIVEGKLKCDPYSADVFLFCGRNSTKMKALVWDGDGFLYFVTLTEHYCCIINLLRMNGGLNDAGQG